MNNDNYTEKLLKTPESTMKFNEEIAMKFNGEITMKFNEEKPMKFNEEIGEITMKFNEEKPMKFNEEIEEISMKFNEEKPLKFNEENSKNSTSTSLKNLSGKFLNEENPVKKPNLRKKICLKLARILKNVYLLERENSQKLALSIESKVRNEFLLMDSQYKSYIKSIFHVLQVFI